MSYDRYCCHLILILLLITFHVSKQQGFVITNPPQNTTVCVRQDVNITCGYSYIVQLGAIWIIGGVSFSTLEFAQNSQFYSPTVNDASDTVLTVYSVSEQMNKTTFQCEFTLVPPVFSPVGILTVMGPPTPAVIKVVERRLTSLVISWDKFSHTSCGDVTYNVTLSDGTVELVEETTTTNNTISFTDLVNDTQYEVTVLAINNAGPGTVVTDYVSTLTPSVPSPPNDLAVKVRFIDYKPVVTMTWKSSSLTPNMPMVDKYVISLTDDDDTTTNYTAYNTTFSSGDEEYPINLVVGKDYTVVVHSVNSVGNSEGVGDIFAVQWLQSARVTILPDNKAISISCVVTESSPPVKCYVMMSCTSCKEFSTTPPKVFTNQTTLEVSPEASYHISVQVVRVDVFEKLEDYQFVKNVTIPKSGSQSHIGTSSSESDKSNNAATFAGIVGGVIVIIIGAIMLVIGAVLLYQCRFRKRKSMTPRKHKTEIPSVTDNADTIKMQSCPAYEVAHGNVKMQSCPAYESVGDTIKMQSCPAYETV